MKIDHSPDTIPQSPTAFRQRWLHWNVPAYFAATWIRHAKANFPSNDFSISESLMWEEIDCDVASNIDFEELEARYRLQYSSCLLVGVERSNPLPMLAQLVKLKNYQATQTPYPIQGQVKPSSPFFLIVLCFDADEQFKRTLLEIGADFVIDQITLVPNITRKIARAGAAYPEV